jgi:hypothetical protein
MTDRLSSAPASLGKNGFAHDYIVNMADDTTSRARAATDRKTHRRYYASMMNALCGLQDDLDTNRSPDEAKDLFNELIEVCRSDMNIQFGPEPK